MLNAIEPGSPLPIHRHRKSSETVVCLRGRLVEEFYDDAGALVESVEPAPGGSVVCDEARRSFRNEVGVSRKVDFFRRGSKMSIFR